MIFLRVVTECAAGLTSKMRERDNAIREHPDDYDPNFEDVFVKLVDRLDPLV